MLKIYYGAMSDVIYDPSMYFDNVYLDEWITDDFAKRVIKDIDKAVVLSPGAVDSKYLGVIPVTKISRGTKALLLMKNEPQKVFNASACGDNCAKWILRIARSLDCDLVINLYHIMDFGNASFDIEIINNHTVVHNMGELVLYAGDFL